MLFIYNLSSFIPDSDNYFANIAASAELIKNYNEDSKFNFEVAETLFMIG